MPPAPNAATITFWNELAGPRWVRLQAELDAQLEPFGQRVLDAAALAAGEAVLDVGCGCGTFTLEIARLVGEAGSVCGVDVSAPMLDEARKSAEQRQLRNLELLEADAQTHRFVAQSFDAILSRCGVMFFDDSVAAFANLRRALRSGGRLVFVCFQAIQRNLWAALPLSVVARHTTLEPPAAPLAPGPFAFADGSRVRSILEAAGFSEVSVDPVDFHQRIGSGLDAHAAADLLLELGPAGGALRDKDASVRKAVAAELADLLLPHQTQAGVMLPCSAWLARAR